MSGKDIAASQFERAANLINLEDYMRKILMTPFREVQVELPVRMDDGRIEVFTAFNTTAPAGRVRAASAITPRPITTKSSGSRRS
jgi:glutamate dehydrogenase (NAD(P)+)